MAFSPRITVRLTPTQLSALECLAEQQHALTAAFAHEVLVGYVQRQMQDPAIARACQRYHMAKMEAFAEDATVRTFGDAPAPSPALARSIGRSS